MRLSVLVLLCTSEVSAAVCTFGTNDGCDIDKGYFCKKIGVAVFCGCEDGFVSTTFHEVTKCRKRCSTLGEQSTCSEGEICTNFACKEPAKKTPTKKCLAGWGDDTDNCHPQAAVLTCSATGFKLTGLTKEIMYESVNALKSDKTYGINANGKNVANFDDKTGAVTIDAKWNDIENLIVTHESKKLKFEVEISADDPAMTLPGDVVIHTTRTESFKITCTYSDSLDLNIDPFNVKIGDEMGTSGSVDQSGAKDVWANTFNLNVFSDKEYKTKITSDAPIVIGNPVYSQIQATDLPTALQFFVANCQVKASAEKTEKMTATIFQNYECYNPVFGDAASIFMGRSLKDGATSEYKFSFPAFSFTSLADDQLHMTCSITICPADTDCIDSSYSGERKIDNDSCNDVTSGYKANISPNRCCKKIKITSKKNSWDTKCDSTKKQNGFRFYECSNGKLYFGFSNGQRFFNNYAQYTKQGATIPEHEKDCFYEDHANKIEFKSCGGCDDVQDYKFECLEHLA